MTTSAPDMQRKSSGPRSSRLVAAPPPQPGPMERLADSFFGMLGHVGQIWDMTVGTLAALFRRPFEGREMVRVPFRLRSSP